MSNTGCKKNQEADLQVSQLVDQPLTAYVA